MFLDLCTKNKAIIHEINVFMKTILLIIYSMASYFYIYTISCGFRLTSTFSDLIKSIYKN